MQDPLSPPVSSLFLTSELSSAYFGFGWVRPALLRRFNPPSFSSEKRSERRAEDAGECFGLFVGTCCWRELDLSILSSRTLKDSPAVGDVGGVMGVTTIRGVGRCGQSVAVGKWEICLEVLWLSGGVESGVRGRFEEAGSESGPGLAVGAAGRKDGLEVFHFSSSE